MIQRQLFQSHKPSPTVSIIGSAGRKNDKQKMTKELFGKMVEKTKEVIQDEFKLKLDEIHAVSGGAAWADHVAVVLFAHEDINQLTLHLPARWENSKFAEKVSMSQGGWKCPGQSANELHKQFSAEVREDTLGHIKAAIAMGAKYYVHDGFQKRNTEVARSQYLIAFSWGEGDMPKKGGTLDTWGKCDGKKVHIPLSSLLLDTHSCNRKRGHDSDSDNTECDGPKRPRIEKGEPSKTTYTTCLDTQNNSALSINLTS